MSTGATVNPRTCFGDLLNCFYFLSKSLAGDDALEDAALDVRKGGWEELRAKSNVVL